MGKMVGSGGKSRTFLFLQGPASRAFGKLGKALLGRGHSVYRVNFQGGDQLFWRLPGSVNFRGRDADWPATLETLIVERGVTDIVLFGDCRPRHQAAIRVARRLQLPVHVFEEGYIRPNWVTYEIGGVNGHSSLPSDPSWYREQAAKLPPVLGETFVPSSFARRATEDVAYNMASMLLAWSFPFYRTHRPWHPMVEYGGWVARLVRRRLFRSTIKAEAQRALGLNDTYVFPLQLDCDSQVRQHSPFGGLMPAIERVLRSFAAHAPEHTTLIVKEHPLDNGMINWRRRVRECAQRLGIADRVRFIEDGDLTVFTRSARGMVTINSTSGTLALAAGVPVITLGEALYNIPGLTFGGDLDAFWTEATPPNESLFEAFRRVLAHRALVRGGYFSDEGLAMLTEGVLARVDAMQPPRAAAGVRAVAARQPAGRTASAIG